MNRKLVNSKLDKYRERGKGTYTFCQVGCDCNIAVNLLEKYENLQSKIDKIKELKHDWIDIVENETLVFENNNLIEFMNNLENILKEDK